MSLNNLSLPATLLADLYSNVLIEGSARRTLKEVPVPFLGKNQKNILILVQQKNAAYLPEKELAFLTTVLSACSLNLPHVAIVNWAVLTIRSFAVLQAQFLPKKLLLLDVKQEELGLPASGLYTVQPYQDLEFVSVPALTDIEKTREAKSKFWIALKELFCL